MASAQASFDYYAELEVKRTASLEEITSSYRRLARVHHPDRNRGNEARATVAFQRLQGAYETLSDPISRDCYDSRGRRPSCSHPSHAPPGYEAWERDMREREASAAEREAEYEKHLRQAQADRRAREVAAELKRNKRLAAQQKAKDVALVKKNNKFSQERRVQEQRWLEAGAVSEDEKLSTCLHSEHCSKNDLRKKFKCSSCSANRGTM